MPLAEVLKLVKRKNGTSLPWLAISLALIGAAFPAHSECLSPSDAAEATTTTVYRCPEDDPAAGLRPTIVDQGKSTVVEHGAADLPWFEPKPTQTADPLAPPRTVSEPKQQQDTVKTDPVSMKVPATAAD